MNPSPENINRIFDNQDFLVLKRNNIAWDNIKQGLYCTVAVPTSLWCKIM
jgi:hypothetical protein